MTGRKLCVFCLFPLLLLPGDPAEGGGGPPHDPAGSPLIQAAAVLVGEGDDACTLCEGDRWISCKRCDGKGRYKTVCPRCSGKRTRSCPVCYSEGRLTCWNCSGFGKIFWKGGDTDPCKICSKGTIPCYYCGRSKKVPCGNCRKQGRVDLVCGACLGAGGFPCPRCPPPDPCRVCARSGRMPCVCCFGEEGFKIRCEKCRGYGTIPCPPKECVGGRYVCDSCHGTGRVRFVMGQSRTKAGAHKCDECSGRGWSKCEKCSGKGCLPCPPTSGIKPCPECTRTFGTVPCTFCDTANR